MFIIVLHTTPTTPFYLRSTIWTSDLERAQKFPSLDAAKAQLDKAAKFMKIKSNAKRAMFMPVE